MNDEDHSNVRDELAAFLDGELSEARRRVVANHLRSCVACRSEVRRLEGLERLLTDHAPRTQPTVDFERRFAEAFRREAALRGGRIPAIAARRRALRRWARPMWIPLSAAAIAAGATFVFWPDTRPQSAIVAEATDAVASHTETARVPALAATMDVGLEIPAVEPMPNFLTIPRPMNRTGRGFTLAGEPGYALPDGAVVPAAAPQPLEAEIQAQ